MSETNKNIAMLLRHFFWQKKRKGSFTGNTFPEDLFDPNLQYLWHVRARFHHAYSRQTMNSSTCILEVMPFEKRCLFKRSPESNSQSDFRWKPDFFTCHIPGAVMPPEYEQLHSGMSLLCVSLSAGYILALGPLVFVSVFDVWLAKFTTGQAYIVNLVSVGVVAFGCTGTKSICLCVFFS